jgi:RES domain-containing protein
VKSTGWRIYQAKHSASAFTGEGARLYGGRWNSPGTAVVYLAGSASLAALELLVHLSSPQVLQTYSLCEVKFDEQQVQNTALADLPSDWWSSPPPFAIRQLGDAWAAAKSSLLLRVPSAIIDHEFNYLLNPAHSDFPTVQIGTARAYRFDPRLIK